MEPVVSSSPLPGITGTSERSFVSRRFRPGEGIIVIFTVAMVCFASALGVWVDELYTLHSTSFGALQAFNAALHFEQQPPLYFVTLSLWRLISPSDVFARCFSVACSTVALLVMLRFVRAHFAGPSAPLFIALLALNPFFIWAALEIRTYAMVLAEAAIIVTSFYDGFLGERVHRRSVIVFAVASILGVYTQYYVGFIVVGCALVVLCLRRERLMPFAATIAPFAVAIIPAATLALWQARQLDHILVHVSLNVRGLMATIQTFVLPREWAERQYHVGVLPKVAYTAFATACAVPPVRALWQVKSSMAARSFAIIALTVTTFFLAMVILHIEMYFPRHITVLFVPLTLAIFAYVVPVCQAAPYYTRSLVAGYALLAITSLIFTYRPLAKSGDWQRVGSYLDAHAEPNDVIDIFDAEMELAVRHYYHGKAILEPLPVRPRLDRWDTASYRLVSVAAAGRAIERNQSVGGRRWLIISPYPCPQFETVQGCSNLMRYVRASYRVISEHPFFDSDVLLVQKQNSSGAKRSVLMWRRI